MHILTSLVRVIHPTENPRHACRPTSVPSDAPATQRQTIGTAAGKELEVSERTIYRDIEALSMAGIPVYGEPGREGGFALVDHYRTTLTGLSDAQVQALFMLNIPAPLADLGVRQEARTALLKIAAALPGDHREDERRVRQRFFLDAVGWDRGEEAVPHLQTIHNAVWQDRELWISYQIGPLAGSLDQRVKPYGLVAKAGIWYLVYRRGEAMRVHRVSRLLDARLAEETFVRPSSTTPNKSQPSMRLYRLCRANERIVPALERSSELHDGPVADLPSDSVAYLAGLHVFSKCIKIRL